MIDTSKFNKNTGGMAYSTLPITGYGQPGQTAQPQNPFSTYTMPNQSYSFPGANLWSEAANMYRQAGTQLPQPGAWGTAENAYNQLLGGQGNPVDVTGW